MKTEIRLYDWEDRNEHVKHLEEIIEKDINTLEKHCHAESTKERARKKLEDDRRFLENAKAKKVELEQRMKVLKNTDGVFTILVEFIDYGGHYVEGHKEYVFNTFEEAMNFYDKQPKNGYYVYYLECEPVEDYIKKLEKQKAVYLEMIAELDKEIKKVQR